MVATAGSTNTEPTMTTFISNATTALILVTGGLASMSMFAVVFAAAV